MPAKDELIRLRVTSDEKQLLADAAKRSGQSLSEWSRTHLLAASGSSDPKASSAVRRGPAPGLSLDPVTTAAGRQRKLTPDQVDAEIASEIEKLKARAVVPDIEPVDEAEVVAEQQKLRAERRADNLRRLKAPVLVQRQSDGGIVFRHDHGIADNGYIAAVERGHPSTVQEG